MSVRHVHARPGEYIAVHRSGRRPSYRSSRGGGSGGSYDGMGCVFLILIGFIIFFWKILLICCISILVLAGLCWLIYHFRMQLLQFCIFICKWILHWGEQLYITTKNAAVNRINHRKQQASLVSRQKYPDYGKIIQNRRQ